MEKKDQEIISLKILSKLTFSEIAEILGESTNTIKWRYYKSMYTLKILLSNLSMFIVTATLGILSIKNQNKNANELKDGGTIEYKALLYTITDYHKIAPEGSKTGYLEGIKIEIFNSLEKKTETTTTNNEERIKIEDLKIRAENIDTTKLVKFEGILYGKPNEFIDYAGDLNKSIGKIDLLIGEEYLPQLDGETNCKEFCNCNVLEANEKTMVLNIDNVAVLFRAIDKENIKKSNGEILEIADNIEYSSFVGTILEETTKYMIVEPNEDEEERKSSDKIKINYGTDHMDYLYGIGRKVVIYYTGYIMESDPAQINTNKIETEGYENFEITVKKSKEITKKKILNNKDLSADGQDFNLYYYGLDAVNVKVDNKEMSLEEALKSGKLTLQGIIQKANRDEKDGKLELNGIEGKADTDFLNARICYDGGSTEYHYKDYTIIKVHNVAGNRDVYVGIPEMNLKDLKL